MTYLILNFNNSKLISIIPNSYINFTYRKEIINLIKGGAGSEQE